MKLHLNRKSAWHLAPSQGVRNPVFAGPVEADETGGREKNRHANEKLRAGRGAVGKTAVARAAGQVKAEVVPDTCAETLQGFVVERTKAGATVCEAAAYTVRPSARNGQARRRMSGSHERGGVVPVQARPRRNLP